MSISFDAPRRITGTPAQDAEPPQISASGDHAYLLWHEVPTAAGTQPDVFFARSGDGGRSFGSRVNLSNSPGDESSGEDLTVSDGDVYVVWAQAGVVQFRKSTNDGGSFSPAIPVSSTPGAARAQVKVDDDDVYVVWEAVVGGVTDIFFAHSGNDGKSFGDEINVSRSAGASESAQLTLSDDGVVVTWRDDTPVGAGFEIFTARGED